MLNKRAVQVAIPPLEAPLTYLAEEEISVGAMVEVPLGKQSRVGWVVSTNNTEETKNCEIQFKEINQKILPAPVFGAELLKLFQWTADYYGYPLSQVIDTAIPPYTSPRRIKHISLSTSFDGKITGKKSAAILDILRNLNQSISPEDLDNLYRDLYGTPTRSPDLKGEKGDIRAVLTTLRKKGAILIEETVQHIEKQKLLSADWAKKEVSLNEDQEKAVKKINDCVTESKFNPFLLFGVTGSGKTEVYIESIIHTLNLGKGVLILVPEIALTPQLIDRFRARITLEIAVLHSGLSKRERWRHWEDLVSGEVRIALGARSAVFAPIDNLGLVIVDEEHDSSFKQSDGLRYHGRDLAVVRANNSSCTIVLGSATPSLETVGNVARKRYRQLVLPQRHSTHGVSPITIIDMTRLSPLEKSSNNFSLTLVAALQECVSRGEQAFILHNKRGFSSYLQCDWCGCTISCPNCSVTLTFHKINQTLLCHLCGHETQAPEICDACYKKSDQQLHHPLTQCGSGTERIAEELSALIPDARIERLDRDTVDSESAHRAIFDRVRSGEVSILVGTQMIAKGHDLPLVTLVGVIDADVGLHLPDFRASERVFQLLTQVAGRAGRGNKAGRVIIQTKQPEHLSLVCTAQRNFTNFAVRELESRRELRYPPFSHLIRFVVSGIERQEAAKAMADIHCIIKNEVAKGNLAVQILGPSAAPFERIRGRWRFHCLIRASTRANLHKVLGITRLISLKGKNLRLTWDVDPFDLL